MGRTVDRIAHQIIEKLAGSTDAVLLGIPTRGAPLARRLGARIAAFGGGNLPVGSLDITLFRDDLRRGRIRPLAETVEPSGGIDGKVVILVDDVLFSGRSVRAALDAVRELGRPRAVQLAVLVDRGHRELPDPRGLRRQEPAHRADLIGPRPAERDRRRGRRLRERGIPMTPPHHSATRALLVGLLLQLPAKQRFGQQSGRPGVTRHLLSAGDLDHAAAVRILDDAEQLDRTLAGREVKKLPTLRGPHGGQPVLRGLDPDPDVVRAGGQAAVGRRRQLLGQGIERVQGRVAQGHRADPGGDGRGRRRHPALLLGRGQPARDLGAGQRRQRR